MMLEQDEEDVPVVEGSPFHLAAAVRLFIDSTIASCWREGSTTSPRKRRPSKQAAQRLRRTPWALAKNQLAVRARESPWILTP